MCDKTVIKDATTPYTRLW